MNNFCTLFDTKYLTRGLALYESLYDNIDNFHLYIFAFDDHCYKKLKELSLKKVTIISLDEFEDEELLKVKDKRTNGEYCWTCTPSTILYVLKNFNIGVCTYLDADLYFFNSPEQLLNELRDNSVIITEHRYTDKYNQLETSGRYCVQFMTFKNDKNGLVILNWWREACIDWCYARVEDGKFGDQKYLDSWVEEFSGVHELVHLGGGVAPWNVQQYDIKKQNNIMRITEKKCKKSYDLIFYHFHALMFFNKDVVHLSYYEISDNVRDLIYKEYIKKIEYIIEKYNLDLSEYDYNCISNFLSDNLDDLKKEKNYFRKSSFL